MEYQTFFESLEGGDYWNRINGVNDNECNLLCLYDSGIPAVKSEFLLNGTELHSKSTVSMVTGDTI